jgi:hypothetical protein
MCLHVKHFVFQVKVVTMVGMEMEDQWVVVPCEDVVK